MKIKNVLSLAILLSSFIAGCAYTQKVGDQYTADSAFKETLLKADYAMQLGNWTKAAMLYDFAADMRPDNLQLRSKEAQAYRSLGSSANARKIYQMILDSKAESNEINDIARQEAEAYLSNSAGAKQLNTNLSVVDNLNRNQEFPLTDRDIEANQLNGSSEKVVPTELDINRKESNIASASSNSDDALIESTIKRSIDRWVSAWQSKNLDIYYLQYAPNFDGGLVNHEFWKKDRALKIQRAQKIHIQVTILAVNLIGDDQAEVTLKQKYSSESFEDEGEKKLNLKLIEGKWLITRETFLRLRTN